MEREVGMYVRYKNGIGKIVARYVKGVLIDKGKGGYFRTENIDISKASYNIIDLIEVGDYVNGWRVNRVEREEDGTFLTVGTLTSFVSRNETEPYLTQDYNEADKICKIKSIVTKEAFESMKYEL